jgi:hypothetical protein
MYSNGSIHYPSIPKEFPQHSQQGMHTHSHGGSIAFPTSGVAGPKQGLGRCFKVTNVLARA